MRVQLGQSAALYCRVSTAGQTCARQERDLRAFAKKAGYKVAGVWKETASGAKNERIERKKVLALAQARNIDCPTEKSFRPQPRLPSIECGQRVSIPDFFRASLDFTQNRVPRLLLHPGPPSLPSPPTSWETG